MIVRVSCTYSYTTPEDTNEDAEASGDTSGALVVLTAKYFDRDIVADSFFSLRVPGFFSPRSTAATDSFQFTSYDADGKELDKQTIGLVAKATEFNEIKTVSF